MVLAVIAGCWFDPFFQYGYNFSNSIGELLVIFSNSVSPSTFTHGNSSLKKEILLKDSPYRKGKVGI